MGLYTGEVEMPVHVEMIQKLRDKASPPPGSWPEGPERAGNGIPAASGRLMVSLPQMGKVPDRADGMMDASLSTTGPRQI